MRFSVQSLWGAELRGLANLARRVLSRAWKDGGLITLWNLPCTRVWGIARHSQTWVDVSEKKNKILVFCVVLLLRQKAGLFALPKLWPQCIRIKLFILMYCVRWLQRDGLSFYMVHDVSEQIIHSHVFSPYDHNGRKYFNFSFSMIHYVSKKIIHFHIFILYVHNGRKNLIFYSRCKS